MSDTGNSQRVHAPLNSGADPIRDRYLAGLAAQLDLEPSSFAEPGTTVLGRPDRAGTGAAVAYWADAHLVVWADPAVVEALNRVVAGAGTRAETLAPEAFDAAAIEAGFTLQAEADMCTMASPPPDQPPDQPPGDRVPAELDVAGYEHRWLDAQREADVEFVKAFVARSDPDEVEEAGLEEIDDSFEETAINVLVDPADPTDQPAGSIRAYASAATWDWDSGFGDIGVLVDPRCRRQGLAVLTVSQTVNRLLATGLLPLYRYETTNLASARVAATLGFRPATKLSFYRRP